jgi:hypothetical protein
MQTNIRQGATHSTYLEEHCISQLDAAKGRKKVSDQTSIELKGNLLTSDIRAMMLRLYNEANVELIDNSLLRKAKPIATPDQSSIDTPQDGEEPAVAIAEENAEANSSVANGSMGTVAVENGASEVPMEG